MSLHHTTHVQKLIAHVSCTIWTRRAMRVKWLGGKSAGFYTCSKNKRSPMIIGTSNLLIADTSISRTHKEAVAVENLHGRGQRHYQGDRESMLWL